MRDGPPAPFTTNAMYRMSPLRGSSMLSSSSPRNGGLRSHSSHGTSSSNNSNNSNNNYPMRNSSPIRGTGVDYTSGSTSSLLLEITSLRARLRELEDDNKSSVVSVNVNEENKLEAVVNALRNDIAHAQQEKALQEKEYLNQMTTLQSDYSKQVNELKEALQQQDVLNNALNNKLRDVVLQNDELNEQLTMIKEERKTLSDQLQTISIQRDEAKEKLQQAKIESAISRSKNDTEDKYTRLLEDQRELHLKEIEQMKQHLQNADMEIADSRTEMDQLHDEISEMQNYREALLEEVTTVRLDLSEEKRMTQNLRKEITDMKLKVERMQQDVKEKDIRFDHKSDPSNRVIKEKEKIITSQRKEIDRMQSRIQDLEYHEKKLLHPTDLAAKTKSLSVDTDNQDVDDDDDNHCDDLSQNRPITPAERDQLIQDMQALETRMLQFHSKLADKECKIDDLSASLAEERQTNKQLRDELEQLETATSSKTSPTRQLTTATSDNTTGTQAELLQLKKQNRALLEEVEALRIAGERTKVKKGPPPSLLSPPSLHRTISITESRNDIADQPRTPVSGLVATFERHSRNVRGISNGENNNDDMSHITESVEQTTAATNSVVLELQQSLKREKRLVLDLQKQLRTDKQTIWELQEKLCHNKDSSLSSASKIPGPNSTSPTCLAAELCQSKKENERLQTKVREMERNNTIIVKERAELSKLRSEAVYASMERDDNEQMINDCRDEIKRLLKQLHQQESIKALFVDEEKKSDVLEDDIADLRMALAKKEKELEKLREQHEKYVSDSVEELGRLRSQVDALQSELESAMTKIELIQTELTGRDRKTLERELKTVELELAMSKTRHADLVAEHAEKIEGLEEKILTLEGVNETLATETPAHVQRDFDNEAKALATELGMYRSKMLDLEMSSSLKIKDLENQISSLQVELEEEKKEKDSLQKCLETSESAAVDAPKLNAEIDRLSSALTAAQLNKKNSDRENLEQLRILEDEVEILELEATEELEKKCSEIDTLKSELERKEENIQRLEKEKQQICLSMNDASFSRKGELEESQAELLDMTNQTKTQGREIQILQMKLQEHENRRDEIGGTYQRKIRELEDEIRRLNDTARKVHSDRDGILQLKSENAQLRETLRDVKIDRRQLKDRLDSLVQDKTSVSRSSQLLRDRNNALQTEVEKLAKRLKKMEANIKRVEF